MQSSILSALLALGVWGGITGPAAAQGYRPRVGERHPDFTLPSIQDASPMSLSQFRGRKVLLIQFAAW